MLLTVTILRQSTKDMNVKNFANIAPVHDDTTLMLQVHGRKFCTFNELLII